MSDVEEREGRPMSIAVLASGSGTNFQALLDRFRSGGDESARVVRLVASRPGAGALERARAAGVPTRVLGPPDRPREEQAKELLAVLEEAGTALIVLAGYLRMVPAAVVRAYRGRIVNIHPALLPAFGGQGMYGRRVHEAVIEAGVRVSGVTVHFVDEVYDRGAIIAQWPVPVLQGDDAASLAGRVLEVEHRVLPDVVSALARGQVRLDEQGRCRWEGRWFEGVRFVTAGERRT